MGLLSWIRGLGSSDKKEKQTEVVVSSDADIELMEYQKDIKEMEKDLERLKSRKFRTERVEYNHATENVKVFYYAQIHGKRKHNSMYNEEYNNNEWWRLCTGHGGNVFIYPYMGGGAARSDEQGALELIEKYKKDEEEEIRRRPERKKFLREHEKYKAERKKELKAEYERTKPKSTYKEI